MHSRQLKALNALRQKRLEADTDRLLQLARELKAGVDSTSSDAAGGQAVKKADQIEKLAKSVREKMKASP